MRSWLQKIITSISMIKNATIRDAKLIFQFQAAIGKGERINTLRRPIHQRGKIRGLSQMQICAALFHAFFFHFSQMPMPYRYLLSRQYQ